ncbi:MAG: glutamate racemase [Clostridia bacterium]|nr:glutamate racemase [Clostridia bacterium]
MGFIGVIDSGVGGLTILQQLKNTYNCNFCYLADHAFCPYGNKSNDVLHSRAITLTQYLMSHGAQAVVFACNTLSAFAKDVQTVCNLPVYEVITPTCNAVLSCPNVNRVALLATRSTIQNGAYQTILAEKGITVLPFDCSAFVPYIENCDLSSANCKKAVYNALNNLPNANADAIILGCTHFPLLRDQISRFCPNSQIITCSCVLPLSVSQCGLQSNVTTYLTTGDERSANLAAQCFGNVSFTHVQV